MTERVSVRRRRGSAARGGDVPRASVVVSRPSAGCLGADDEAQRHGDGWLPATIRKVEAMRGLRDDWDTYGAEAPNAVAVANAVHLLHALADEGLPPDRVVPSAEGGVAIAFVRGSRYVNIECYNTGKVLAGLSNGTGVPDVWDIAEADLDATLGRMREYLG